MSWWFWILLWVALCALALLFVVYLGFTLFRQVKATLHDFEAAAGKLGSGFDTPVAGQTKLRTGVPGVFLDPAEAREIYVTGKAERREARRIRRVARRGARGQRQSLRDVRLS
jgi:hypothetical protein